MEERSRHVTRLINQVSWTSSVIVSWLLLISSNISQNYLQRKTSEMSKDLRNNSWKAHDVISAVSQCWQHKIHTNDIIRTLRFCKKGPKHKTPNKQVVKKKHRARFKQWKLTGNNSRRSGLRQITQKNPKKNKGETYRWGTRTKARLQMKQQQAHSIWQLREGKHTDQRCDQDDSELKYFQPPARKSAMRRHAKSELPVVKLQIHPPRRHEVWSHNNGSTHEGWVSIEWNI